MKHFQVKTEDGSEYFKDAEKYYFDYFDLADEALQILKITTPKTKPRSIVVQIYELKIKLGKIEKNLVCTCTVLPKLAPLTKEEIEEEIENSKLPKELKDHLKTFVFEYSTDYESVLNVTKRMITSLESAVKAIADVPRDIRGVPIS